MYDADIRRAANGLGGCKPYDPADFDPEVLPYIEAYFEGNHDCVAITYAAMRAKELELRPVGHEFFVNMQKRGDGKVYVDLHKTDHGLYLTAEEAQAAIDLYPELAQHRHVVRLIAEMPDDDS